MGKDALEMSRSKEKLKKYIEQEITKLFSEVLDYAEVAVDGRDRYKILRSRILKVSNDKIRDIKRELDSRYEVGYVAPAEDMIVMIARK